jgi:hypothetical protein
MSSSSIRQPAFDAVRISPDGTQLAWHRPYAPGSFIDGRPWLVLSEDPALGVDHEWMPDSAVAGWIALEDPAVVRADDAHLAARIRQAGGTDPMPADLPDQVNHALNAVVDAGGGAR